MFLALVIAASVAEGEREGLKIVSPAIALYVSAFDPALSQRHPARGSAVVVVLLTLAGVAGP